jgi:hypothetical protein
MESPVSPQQLQLSKGMNRREFISAALAAALSQNGAPQA